MNYELCKTNCSRVVTLLIDTYIIFFKIYLKISDTSEIFSNLSRQCS